MSTPNEYSVTDQDGDVIMVSRVEDWAALGISVDVEGTPTTAACILEVNERPQVAEILTGDLLYGGDARREVEDKYGNGLVVIVEGDTVSFIVRPARPLLGVAFAAELTLDQAGSVHEMLTR